ncbi:gamma-glutamyl-gamma-aminobutyrate hydrolase family protein, partial [Oleiphilus sp. HI0067]
GSVEQRTDSSDLGGTMRLGAQDCRLEPGSTVATAYGKEVVNERHRHRYEVNNNLLPKLKEAGLIVSGRSMDGALVEVVEAPEHPWFVACQFHPEFTSTPRDGHGLFEGFVKAAIQNKKA